MERQYRRAATGFARLARACSSANWGQNCGQTGDIEALASANLDYGHCPFSSLISWRECVGVEPTHEREAARATVLKTARPTGTHPLPR